jgi:hypothetical protein
MYYFGDNPLGGGMFWLERSQTPRGLWLTPEGYYRVSDTLIPTLADICLEVDKYPCPVAFNEAYKGAREWKESLHSMIGVKTKDTQSNAA